MINFELWSSWAIFEVPNGLWDALWEVRGGGLWEIYRRSIEGLEEVWARSKSELPEALGGRNQKAKRNLGLRRPNPIDIDRFCLVPTFGLGICDTS